MPGVKYNIPMIHALVLYVGTQAITILNGKGLTPSMSTIAHSAHMDIFQNLAVDMDTEGMSHFHVIHFKSLANLENLYLKNHTFHLFSSFIIITNNHTKNIYINFYE